VQLKLLGKSQEVIEQMERTLHPPILGEKKALTALLSKDYAPFGQPKFTSTLQKTTKIEATKRKASSTLRVQLYVSAVMCWGIQLVTSERGPKEDNQQRW